jgi:hypothetical protein
MSRRFAPLILLALAVLVGFAPAARAQLADNLGALSGDNAKRYLAPLPDALSGTMNSAIFTSGKVPKMGVNFAVGVKVMGVNFDKKDRTYAPVGGSAGFTAPSVIGDGTAVTDPGAGPGTTYYPGGFDITKFAFAAPQLSIGSVMGTRAVVRWFGHTFSGDNFIEKIDFLGVGGQHSISQYVPGVPVDLALGVFYQSFKVGAKNNSKLLDIKTIHFDVTGSRSFGILQPYAAVGYDTFKMDANYEDSTNPGSNVAVHFDRTNHMHLTAGLLANLAFVKIHGEANLAATNGLAVGLSFGI